MDNKKIYFVQAAKRFIAQNGSGIPASDNLLSYWESAIFNNPNMVTVIEEGKGFLVGVVYPHLYNPQILCVQELGWWVEPEFRGSVVGIKLMKRFEEEAMARGVSHIMMIHLANDWNVGKIYEKLGYRLAEHTYIKEVHHGN